MTTRWPEVALGDVANIVMGQAPKGETYNDQGEGWPLIAGAGDFGDGVPKAKKFTTTPTRLSRTGDIVLGIRASIGEKVIADGEYCLGRGVAGLRGGDRLVDRYLWFWLSASASRLAAKGRGATFLQVNRADVAEMSIPLPPVEEQRRIAAILDAADELRGKRRASLALLDSLTESIFLDMFGDRPTNPHRLPVVPLVDLVDPASPITRGIDQPGPNFPGGIPYIKTTDFGGPICRDQLACANPEIAARFPRATVSSGDCVICIRATVGPAMLITSDLAGVNLSRGTARVAPRQGVPPRFLLATLQSRDFQNQITERLRGATFLQIPLGELRKLEVLCPPAGKQKEFSLRAEAAEVVEIRADAYERELDVLFASLQHRAFRGEL